MSDELTPEHEAVVRRLLADARHTEPIPADVAARLDDTLAGLQAEAPSVPPADLATARRRRRNAGRLLLAAAAVVVAGVGVGQVIGGDQSGDGASSAGGSSVAEDAAPDREQSAGAAAPAPSALARQVPLQLSGADLATQVETQLAELPSDLRADALSGDATALSDPAFSCQASVDTTDGTRVVPAYVDGAAALLALAPAQGDNSARAAQLLDCASGAELAAFEVTLP